MKISFPLVDLTCFLWVTSQLWVSSLWVPNSFFELNLFYFDQIKRISGRKYWYFLDNPQLSNLATFSTKRAPSTE